MNAEPVYRIQGAKIDGDLETPGRARIYSLQRELHVCREEDIKRGLVGVRRET